MLYRPVTYGSFDRFEVGRQPAHRGRLMATFLEILVWVVMVLFVVGFALSFWGRLPKDRNGRTDR